MRPTAKRVCVNDDLVEQFQWLLAEERFDDFDAELAQLSLLDRFELLRRLDESGLVFIEGLAAEAQRDLLAEAMAEYRVWTWFVPPNVREAWFRDWLDEHDDLQRKARGRLRLWLACRRQLLRLNLESFKNRLMDLAREVFGLG